MGDLRSTMYACVTSIDFFVKFINLVLGTVKRMLKVKHF